MAFPKRVILPDGWFCSETPPSNSLHSSAELLLTGGCISAKEAKDIGLIGHVVPDGQALAKAMEIAEMIANNGPLAVEAILKLFVKLAG